MCKMNVNLIHLFFVKNTYRKGLFIMSKKLVAFFSASGTTKKVAQMIAEEAKADLFEIEPKVPYTKPDLDWMNKKSRSSVEMSDKKYRPAIMKKEMDMSSYDEILLGFPIWWYVAPTIINTFLEAYDFSGKKIVLFATSGGSEFGNTVKELQPSAPDAVITECPMLGLGTFMLSPEDAYTSTLEALKMGYSLIDTANAYVNERAVGRAIKDSGIDRKNIFLSTKIWASEYENENTVEETLERLGVDYVDLLYIHQPAGNWLAGYRMLEKAYREGKAKSIGISNFEGKYMEELETKWEIVPQFIQVEAHPYFTQKELRVTLDKYGIKLMSWYPLGHGDTALMNELVFAGLGKKYGKTPAQVILRWHTQMGFVVIPGSKNAEHIKDNMDIFDFALTDEEMEQIAKLDKNERYYHRTDEQLVQFANWKPEFEK